MRKDIIKIRAEVNEIESKKIIEKNNLKQRVGFLKEKIDKPLARLTKNKGERVQINKTLNERGDIQLIP